MQNIFVGRQPIMNQMLDVFGYELLFRDADCASANFQDRELASSQVIRRAFVDMDFLNLTRGLKCFINVTRDFLLEEEPLPFPIEQVVLEIQESEAVDDELIITIKALSETGLQFALDGYSGDVRWDSLLGTLSYIKIDVLKLTHEQLEQVVAKLTPYKDKILAEKVETNGDLETCAEMGFKYFQGYFFAKPEVISGKTIGSNQAQSLQLLSALQREDVESDEIYELVSRDVTLSYGILKLINSAAFGLPNKVESIRGAVSYIGIKPLIRWLTLLIITNSEDQNAELLSLAIIRARMCELLSKKAQQGDASAYFTVGLFSMLEPLLGVPIEEIIEKLSLSDELCSALIDGDGPMGEAVDCAHAYEECLWDNAHFLNLEVDDIVDIYTESVNWANETTASV